MKSNIQSKQTNAVDAVIVTINDANNASDRLFRCAHCNKQRATTAFNAASKRNKIQYLLCKQCNRSYQSLTALEKRSFINVCLRNAVFCWRAVSKPKFVNFRERAIVISANAGKVF